MSKRDGHNFTVELKKWDDQEWDIEVNGIYFGSVVPHDGGLLALVEEDKVRAKTEDELLDKLVAGFVYDARWRILEWCGYDPALSFKLSKGG